MFILVLNRVTPENMIKNSMMTVIRKTIAIPERLISKRDFLYFEYAFL